MLDTASFVERAERETEQTVHASCEARWRREDAIIGKAGLLCATDDGLAFVEDAILEPGDVSITPREAIRTARLERGTVDTTLVVDTADGLVMFDNIAHDDAQRLADAADLPLAAPGSSETSPSVPAPANAPSLALDAVEPAEAVAAVDPVSARSEELLSEELSARLAIAEETPADELAGTPSESVEHVSHGFFEPGDEPPAPDAEAPDAERAESTGKSRRTPSRKRTRPRAGKPAKDKVGPYGWVSYVVALGLALGGLTYHWSVAVLLCCIGYVVGLYVAEHLNRQRRQD